MGVQHESKVHYQQIMGLFKFNQELQQENFEEESKLGESLEEEREE